jgi:hypothetical protein
MGTCNIFYCFNCHAGLLLDDNEYYGREFVCPICNCKNKINDEDIAISGENHNLQEENPISNDVSPEYHINYAELSDENQGNKKKKKDLSYFKNTIKKYRQLYDLQIDSYMQYSERKLQLINKLNTEDIDEDDKLDFLISLSELIENNTITKDELNSIKDKLFK